MSYHPPREKMDQELSEHVHKACNSEESAPKQKHVRSCIVYTWDYKYSQSFWTALKLHVPLSEEVQVFKALIVIHKVIRDGHPVALRDAMSEYGLLESMARMHSYDGSRGYAQLIRAYIEFLRFKLEFHKTYKDFTGNFSYEEYIAIKDTANPDEGYQVILDLMTLQDKVDQFQKFVFRSFRPSSSNECRISSLVPLVEESFSIYEFILSMLRSMHNRVDSIDALAPLRDRFREQYEALRRFYFDASSLKYLTSLIKVPQLPDQMPELYSTVRLQAQPKPQPPKQPEPPAIDPALLEKNNQMMQELRQFRHQWERDQELIQQLEMRARQLENELQMRGQSSSRYDAEIASLNARLMDELQKNKAKDDLIAQLQAQVNEWKSKYEKLAKMYAQLRKEHLELLKKQTEITKLSEKAQEDVKLVEDLKASYTAKTRELAEAVKERQGLRAELERIHASHAEELSSLRRDLAESRARIDDLGKSKGAEVQIMLEKYNTLKAELDAMTAAKNAELEKLRSQLVDRNTELSQLAAMKDEEIKILQAGLDQSIMAMAQLQQGAIDAEGDFMAKLDNYKVEHAAELDRILDNVLESCRRKAEQAESDFDDPGNLGNQTASPEYALTTIEKASTHGAEFAQAISAYVSGQGDLTTAITTANNFTGSLDVALNNVKGVCRLAGDDEILDHISNSAREMARASGGFFGAVTSKAIFPIESSKRPGVVAKHSGAVQDSIVGLTGKVEKLIPKEATDTKVDLGDFVEREMMGAAKAIEEAIARLTALMNQPRDSKLTSYEGSVHDSLLGASMTIAGAIARLIQAATASQREIVAAGKGSSTATAFYKKNNRWTEGLISAARMVAATTSALVAAADGVVRGTHEIEQLIVASHEVAAATAQLVAASRVKADRSSKTQAGLEAASKAVTEATKQLVKVAKQISAKKAEDEANARAADLSKLTLNEFKIREMEQQVAILKLEKELANARKDLATMRSSSYHAQNEVN